MVEANTDREALWLSIKSHVSRKVTEGQNSNGYRRDLVITYLRDLEELARLECRDFNIVQVIQSGRHLLGDEMEFGPLERDSLIG